MNTTATKSQSNSSISKINLTNTSKKKNSIRDSTFSTIKYSRDILRNKYNTNIDTLYKKIITEIIYNEKSRIVARFKDFLIFDDLSEFFKRFYKIEESMFRMPKIIEYYETYSKIFPSYINLSEAKYIYKNIEKKQKMIDNQHFLENNLNKNLENENIFNTEINQSIMNTTETQMKEEPNEFVNEKFNFDLCQNVNVFEKEDSLNSIEKLIEIIEEKEKNTEKLFSKENMKNDFNFLSPTHRDKSYIDMTSPLKNNLKTIENASGNKLFNSHSSLFSKVFPDKKLFESNLLKKKFKEIKEKRINTNSDLSNTGMTVIRERTKNETISNSIHLNHYFEKNIVSHNKNRSDKLMQRVEIDDTKKILEIKFLEKSKNNKNNLSVPKLNILSVINPNLNQIQIHNNVNINNINKKRENSGNKVNIKSARQSPMPKTNLKNLIKLNEKINFKKMINIKSDIYKLINKNKNTIDTNSLIIKKAFSKEKEKEYKKTKREREITPSIQINKSTHSISRNPDKNTLTIQNEDSEKYIRNKKNNLNDKFLTNYHINSERKMIETFSRIRKQSADKNNFSHSNFNKTSRSPNPNFKSNHTGINSYMDKKTNSNQIVDLKSSLISFKQTGIKTHLQNQNQNETTKGIPIKNFKEVLSVKNTIQSTINSDRVELKKLNKMK